MSDMDFNTLTYRIGQLEQECKKAVSKIESHKEDDMNFYRTVINPFLDKMNTLYAYIEERKSDIKEIPVMKQTLTNLDTWLKDERAMRRKFVTAIIIACIANIAITALTNFLTK